MHARLAVDFPRRWRVLLANVTLAGRTGTETATRGLAIGLRAAGHSPMVYAPALGALADDIRAAGIPVVSHLADLSDAPDVIQGHHHVETMAALLRFPGAAAIFVCHDRTAISSAPPLTDRIQRYVAVDLNCRERLTADYGIPESATTVIPNAVEMDRFQPRSPLPERPRRAAIFSNYAGAGTHLEPIREACAELGLPLDVLGSGVGNEQARPEQVLGAYDIVFAKARCAIEAMTVGCAVVLCDVGGLGPMVTSRTVEHLRLWNFGQRTLRSRLDASAIAAVVRSYDRGDAAAVSAWIRANASLDTAIDTYLAAYAAAWSSPRQIRSIEDDLRQYFTGTAAHIGALETALAAYRQPFRMDALSDDDCARLRVRVRHTPAAIAGTPLRVDVEVVNQLGVPLGTYPPYPLNLSYRWLDASSGAPVVAEGRRTSLTAVAPGTTAVRAMHVPPPEQPGTYRLRVALVQEGLRWLDGLDPPVSDEATVSVARSA